MLPALTIHRVRPRGLSCELPLAVGNAIIVLNSLIFSYFQQQQSGGQWKICIMLLAKRIAKTQTSPSAKNQKKTVRFYPKCDGLFIRYPSAEEKKERWYSKEEETQMKSDRMRDAVACSHLLYGGSVGRECRDMINKKDFLICCTGLDRLMSDDIPQRLDSIVQERKDHVDTVLDEQERQSQRNAQSIVDLARVSKMSSKVSRKRACQVARLTARI